MFGYNFVYIFLAATVVSGADRFPDEFLFGVATSAFQVEGAWNVDGKAPSIWDEFVHSNPDRIIDHSTADVGPNSYEYFMDDIAAIKNLNMNYYRFSIAWSRVLRTGDSSNVNEKGIDYYNKLIDKLLEQNIEPLITMMHFDLPQQLQIFGGFANELIVDYFEAYANLLFERFGDRVKYWITFNEPNPFCVGGYGNVNGPPEMNFSGIGEYLCMHNVLKSHAVAYHLYKQSFYDRFNGQVRITLNSIGFYSKSNDMDTVNRAFQFQLGWRAAPIFSAEGNDPSVMIDQIDSNSKNEGRYFSRLPKFSRYWIKRIRGSDDFFGLNYYTSMYVEVTEHGNNPSYSRDSEIKQVRICSEPYVICPVPQGLDTVLRWIKNEYNNPAIFITENGWSDKGEMEDNDRIQYLHDHLKVIQNAVLNNQSSLKGYTAGSIIDNFEWSSGYTEKFGLYSVNMTSPRKERTPKKSAFL